MALQYDGLDDFGNPVYSYVPDNNADWSPSQSDIGLLASIGYSKDEATDFLKNMEETQAKEGPGVFGSTGGTWSAPSASMWDTVQKFLPGGTYAQKMALATALGGAIKGYMSGSATPQRVGYQGSIPQYTAVRQAVANTYDPNRRPGSGGQQYFTDTQYIPKTDTAGIAAAQAAAQQQAEQMAAANAANPARQVRMAQGGLASLDSGGYLQKNSDLWDYFTSLGFDPLSFSNLMRARNAQGAYPSSASSDYAAPAAPSNLAYENDDLFLSTLRNLVSPSAPAAPSSVVVETNRPPADLQNTEDRAPAAPNNIAYEKNSPDDLHLTLEDRAPAYTGPLYAEETDGPPRDIGAAHGGLMALARGRYLQGSTDGMADKLPASIDGREPAKLSHGEFVVPADVVSHLGNGNSDAGAKKLYSMMDKIRMARTGTKKQGKQINPDKYMPGGAVGYATGGDIKGYAGDTTGSLVSATKPTAYESNLSTWAGPYVTEMLGRAQAAAATPYQAYQGPLTAGPSSLQQQAFTGYSNLQTPTGIGQAASTAGNLSNQMQDIAGLGFYTPGTFGAQQAQQYMNPYLQASLAPQLAEARRQAQISNMQNMAKLTQAGAYGGGRQAVMQAESDRNLGQNLANITGQGLNTAYQQAMAQFNADQARQQAAQQFGAQFGLQGLQGALQAAQAQGSLSAQQNQMNLANLAAQATAGTAQRNIESEGLAADLKQFEEARDYPLKMAQYMSSILPNLPLATQGSQTTTTNALQNTTGGLTTTLETLKNLGYTITPPK